MKYILDKERVMFNKIVKLFAANKAQVITEAAIAAGAIVGVVVASIIAIAKDQPANLDVPQASNLDLNK